jgi:hypothetical protein
LLYLLLNNIELAFHTRKQFAELCGIDHSTSSGRGTIGMAIKRGKIVLSGELIDDQFPENAEYLRKVLDNVSSTAKAPVIDTPERNQPKVPTVAAPKGESGYVLERQLKQQELEKKEVETRLLNLKEQKMLGEQMPTELVKKLIFEYNQSSITSQKDGYEDLLIIISKEANLNEIQLANLRRKMVDVVNTTVNKAIDMTKRNLKIILSEFSESKRVGEHG